MDRRMMKELRQIRNLLILIAMTSGASADEVGHATGMGRTNVSALIPRRKNNKKEHQKT
jgi:hypothetical protein